MDAAIQLDQLVRLDLDHTAAEGYEMEDQLSQREKRHRFVCGFLDRQRG
jgi:hypothetical protein